MVAEERPVQETWSGLDRQARIDRALSLGDSEFAEWMRRVDFGEPTPEEGAEDARIARERIAKGRFVPAEVVEACMAAEEQEDAKFFQGLEAQFPGATELLLRDPYTPQGREFFFRLREAFPVDMDDYLGADYFFQADQ